MAVGAGSRFGLVRADGGVLDPRGPGAQAGEDLWWLMLVLGIAVFAVFAFLLVAGIRRRATDDGGAPADQARLIRRWVVAGGVVMPLVVIAIVFAGTLVAMKDTPTTAGADALTVEVTGYQWWYEVRYPDDGVATANELHIPVGRPVVLRLTSADVIHSFWVPAFGGKMDMLPERENTLVLQADAPGEHRSRCAEFCGLSHANMEMVVVAESPEDFAAWLDGQRASTRPAGEDAARGRQVFVQSGCVRCHAPLGQARDDPSAPDLTRLASRRTIGAGVLDNTRANAAAWITDPKAVKPGAKMPATSLSREHLDALLAYLGYRR